MELITNRKLTALRTDHARKNSCFTVYSFGINFFYMQVILISNTFRKNYIIGVVFTNIIEQYPHGDITAGID